MKSLLSQIIPAGRDVAYNMDIVSVSMPKSSVGDFEMLISTWPDYWNYHGPRSLISITASGARLLEDISEEEITGYELRNLMIDEQARYAEIYVTLRVVKLSYDLLEITEKGFLKK
ncbi:hypothetical protein KUW17_10230 [Leisingera aquaemixtae]|uniref:hypothetical protein n=1 Tax=Leisingera aquaemixtae TaxID=1396826 RepID=UPI001C939E09|nr:hypothetical protein [Leisingera aquaemixtae]MBY6067118.1 hypothetical protein [Leisingera aquaemixtae]